MSDKNKATITVDENDILKMSEKIQQNIQEDKAFAQNLDNFLKPGNKNSNFLHVGSTSNALAISGANQSLNVVIAPKTISKCMTDSTNKYHGHGLSQEIMEQLPPELRNPIMVFKGSADNSLVAITSLKDKEQHEIMVAISLNEISRHHEVNRISSVYGKDKMNKYLRNQLEQGNLIACNKTKANAMLQSAGLQLPLEETFISFDDSIAYSTQNVKHPEQNINAEIENNRSSDNSISNTEQNVEFYAIGIQPNEKGRILAELHAEVSNDGNFKVNPDYFRSLPRDERAIEQFPTENALDIMQQLSDNAVEFSAVSRKNEVTAITVSKTDVPILQKISESLNNEAVAQAEPKINDKQNSTINPDYYSQLNKSERHISRMSPASGEKVIGALKAADIPFSAVKGDKLTSITVHRDNAQKLDRIINENNNRTAKEYINSDFFKSLPPEERYYTQITGVNDAEKLMDKLQKSDIRFSAVIDRENNTAKLTTDKKDSPEVRKTVSALFSRKSQQGFADKARARNCELIPKSADRNSDRHESL